MENTVLRNGAIAGFCFSMYTFLGLKKLFHQQVLLANGVLMKQIQEWLEQRFFDYGKCICPFGLQF